MRTIGWIVAAMGLLVIVLAWTMDVAAPGGRIANLDLMNTRLIYVITGGFFMIGGLMLVGISNLTGPEKRPAELDGGTTAPSSAGNSGVMLMIFLAAGAGAIVLAALFT